MSHTSDSPGLELRFCPFYWQLSDTGQEAELQCSHQQNRLTKTALPVQSCDIKSLVQDPAAKHSRAGLKTPHIPPELDCAQPSPSQVWRCERGCEAGWRPGTRQATQSQLRPESLMTTSRIINCQLKCGKYNDPLIATLAKTSHCGLSDRL